MLRWFAPFIAAALLSACAVIETEHHAPQPPAAVSQSAELVPVTFSLRPPGNPHSVYVTGDFANWDPQATPMSDDDGDGVWTATVPLPRGEHLYKFVVNGTDWMEDPLNSEHVDDNYGGYNSVLHVE
jgi:cyclomaltodextrinase